LKDEKYITRLSYSFTELVKGHIYSGTHAKSAIVSGIANLIIDLYTHNVASWGQHIFDDITRFPTLGDLPLLGEFPQILK
jgi:hypothetical protein